MLPHISSEENIPPVGRKVYINPNFHSQIANSLQQSQGRPNNESTLQPSWERPSIHVNPYFLQRQREYQMQIQLQQMQQQQQQQQLVTYYQQQQTVAAAATDSTPPPAKIISKASTCLVRKQPVKKAIATAPTPTVCPQAPLVSISKRKLVRQGANIAKASPPATSIATIVPSPAKRTRYKLVRAISLNSTSSTPLVKTRRTRDFVARYALRRTNESLVGKKLSLKSHILKPSVNKSLSMVSIHGVMYKKTAKNKLTKLDTSKSSKIAVKPTPHPSATASTGRTLFVRGTKFVLDPSGCRLTRVPLSNVNKSLLSRIDIGGLTYVSSPSTKNVFIRTSNHVARAHLQTAKQRSLQLLNRSLVKTNVPCAIFQRLGKCAAHSRGKCRRLHDKRQVAICPSFLRGECAKSDCLLSHNVTLEKMPVCRYFLRGACVREDCPYLHKKLSLKAEICIDFLRGYCSRAANCNMRHEFICPEFARKGKCELTNCSYCKQMKQQQKQKFTAIKSKTKPKLKVPVPAPNVKVTKENITKVDEAPNNSRYFKCESEKVPPAVHPQDQDPLDDEDEVSEEESSSAGNSNGPRQRPKLGTLPAFIPLGGSEEC